MVSRVARVLGICAQALVLGALLFLALVQLVAERGGATAFLYQRF